MYIYQAYGLIIQSELLLPELVPLESSADLVVDVRIHWGAVDPEGLSHPIVHRLGFQISADSFWLSVPNIARYLVKNGNDITIDAVDFVDEDSIRLFLLGSCLGVLLMQHRYLVLHANVVRVGDSAVLFSGVSGAGKSTTAAALHARGYALLADDICAVRPDGLVLPGFPQLKLWSDTTKMLGIEVGSLRKIRPNLEKYALPMPQKFHNAPLLLKKIYVLSTHNQECLEWQNCYGMDKYTQVRQQLYRPQFVKGFYTERELMLHVSRMLRQVAVTHITRPDHGRTIDELVDRIEQSWHDVQAVSA